MWKIKRTCEFGSIDEDEFYTFEEAKIQFRHIINEKLGEGVSGFIEQIDEYCKKYYPSDCPK